MYLLPVSESEYNATNVGDSYKSRNVLGKLFTTARYHMSNYYLLVDKPTSGAELWNIADICT